MGVIRTQVRFEGNAPPFDVIVKRIAATSGLPINLIREKNRGEDAMREWHARIAFASFPSLKIELKVYRPGAALESLRRQGLDFPWMVQSMEGANEPPGTQTVYVRGYVGQEPTLILATTLALESLGGKSDLSPECKTDPRLTLPVTFEELSKRHRRLRNRSIVQMTIIGVLLPLLIWVWIFQICWHLLTMPKRMRQARRMIEAHQRKSAGRGAIGPTLPPGDPKPA